MALMAALGMGLALCGPVRAQEHGPGLYLVPVGHTVGVKLFARGIVVAKLPQGETPARACGLRAGDVIETCGGVPITSTEQFRALLQEKGKDGTELEVRREEKSMTVSVAPKANEEGEYGIGAWVRDSMAGIGTMTYYDPQSGEFGALGHGITDVDTAQLMPFSKGSILPSTVKAVKRGGVGSAGELRGDFDLSRDLGPLRANTNRGIFGSLRETGDLGPALQVAEPRVGSALVRSNVSGDEVREYEIEILKTRLGDPDGRELLILVKDPELLSKTGGIVQGMSGSPILQDGKFVGAVTHVLLNDPRRGYGISMDSMLKAAK